MKLLFIFSIPVSRYMIFMIFLSNFAWGICYVNQFSDSTSENIIIIIQNRWKISNVVFVYDLYKKGIFPLFQNDTLSENLKKKNPKQMNKKWWYKQNHDMQKKKNLKQEIDLILYKWYQRSKNKNKTAEKRGINLTLLKR